jgi:hypothetical protein
MKLNSILHVYRYVPNFLDNRKLPAGEQLVIPLKVTPMPDQDAYNNQKQLNFSMFSPDKAQEENDRILKDLVKSKQAGEIEGAEFPEGKVTDLVEFYKVGAPEIVAEVFRAVMSSTLLSMGEQKNFMPESGSPSGSPAILSTHIAA